MSSSLRQATVIMILAVFLAPGLLQARNSAWERASVNRPAVEQGFFGMVWNLLTDTFENGVRFGPRRTGLNKNGGMVDPSGSPAPGGNTSTAGDNGGMVEPSGGK